MAGFAHSNSQHGQLTINSVSLMGSAWRVLNLSALYSVDVRGSSALIPGTAGRTSRRRRVDELRVGLEMIVRGDVNSSGVAQARSAQASTLATNTATVAAIATPASNQTGHSISWTRPSSGTAVTASGWVELFEVQPDPGGALINLVAFDLVIPAGVFV